MKQIVIDYAERVRTALVDDGELIEVLVDDPAEPQLIGNIYLGLVDRVLPNGFAFIDIGQGKSAFMDTNAKRRKFKQGERILVQIIRGARAGKGALASTELSFPGKYAVLCTPAPAVVGVSQKIESKAERKRLRKIAKDLLMDDCGIIIRTCAAGVSAEVIGAEINRLFALSEELTEHGKYAKAPSAVYEKSHPLYGTLQSLMDSAIERVTVNKHGELEGLREVMAELDYDPGIVAAAETEDIFRSFGISEAFEKAFDKRVWLKSGGHIVIEQTEACVVIDVNTGRSIRKSSLFTTNCEAAVEISKQLRLRNLSGMIIIDFIDMKRAEDKRRLQLILEQAVKNDRLRVNVVGLTELGLMQLTRKRTVDTLHI